MEQLLSPACTWCPFLRPGWLGTMFGCQSSNNIKPDCFHVKTHKNQTWGSSAVGWSDDLCSGLINM